ncbi:hypothetical protein G3T20_05865 [Bordetella hinzii]|uniref:hypothetical protein n=1 Tax=Bordetella hinzii TaxID=103855 RepID=UPI0013EFC6E0|nr:hypothetical protein [Bordetella hinzii]QII84269.1 hypothetical protein G3T20_05865 [Bordetella hinzii]
MADHDPNLAAALARLDERMDAHQRILENLEDSQKEVAKAITTLAVVETRQSTQSEGLNRAFKDIGKLQADVAQLIELANRGRGAWAMLLGVGSIVGAVAGWMAEHFLGMPK